MRLIKTDDGLIGLDFDKMCDVIWCHSIEEAVPIATANYRHVEGVTKEAIDKSFRYAMDHMAKTGDTIAQFGVFGGFLYTNKEDDGGGF